MLMTNLRGRALALQGQWQQEGLHPQGCVHQVLPPLPAPRELHPGLGPSFGVQEVAGEGAGPGLQGSVLQMLGLHEWSSLYCLITCVPFSS